MKKIPKIKFHRSFLSFPYMAVCVVFVIVPIILILVYAFRNASGEVSLDAFRERLSDKGTWLTLARSFIIASVTTVACFLLAYPTALALASVKSSKRTVLLMLFIMPIWINSLLRLYAVRLFMTDLFGMERGFWLTLIGMVYDFFPFMLLPIYTVLVDMEKGVIEASYDLGANPVKTFLKVRLPLSVPGIVSGVLMVFMPTVSSFAVFDIMGKDGGTGFMNGKLFGNLVYQYFKSPGGYNSGSVLALILLVLILISTAISNLFTRGKSAPKGGIV